MKRIIIVFVLALSAHYAFSQRVNDTIKLSDLKTPSAPGFQLLDASPSSIERPTNPKEFALSILNNSSNGSVLPKNFALEIAPFWYFKPRNETVYKYLNVSDSLHNYIASGILRKFSISIASVFNDSTSGSMLAKTNYISIGARTNLLTARSKSQNKLITSLADQIANRLGAIAVMVGNDPDSIESRLNTDPLYNTLSRQLKDEINGIHPPLFQLDAAYAYSNAFEGNKYDTHRFNRSGVWVTAALSTSLFKDKSDNLSFIASLRSSRDNLLTDTLQKVFKKTTATDLGGKIEYSKGKLTLAVEYLKRHYADKSDYNSERTVGLIQYKINDNLYVVGTYGKNFGNSNNLFTLFGLNWGFGNSPLRL